MRAEHGAPNAVLGPHEIEQQGKTAVVIRTIQPYARAVFVVDEDTGTKYEMQRIVPEGCYEVVIPDHSLPVTYHYEIIDQQDQVQTVRDPYSFPPLLTDFDLHLISEGTHFDTYEKLGAHIRTVEGVTGVHFAVWAPNAIRVSVVGDFNRWDGRINPMQKRDDTGIWEIFMPGLGEGTIYKYEIRSRLNNYLTVRADPYALSAEIRPKNASVVIDLNKHKWNDKQWMTTRHERQALDCPIAVYEVHLGSWKRVPEEGNRFQTYREMATDLVSYVKQMGYTHIELLPVSEHPYDGSWGYQTTGYYAPSSRFGAPEDFMAFVDACHQQGIGVLLDWVPAHFPKDIFALNYFDGTHLYEHADPRLGEHQDWGTLIFNYGRNEVRNFLISNALFWYDKYHIDGLRVDAVASMLYLDYSRNEGGWMPNIYGGRENLEAISFLKQLNEVVHRRFPDVLTIAEESTAWPSVTKPVYAGGLGFDLKWNMGWMHDTLSYMSRNPIHRRFHHNELTFSMVYAFTEQFLLPLSHDEVVHGKGSLIDKMPGDYWQKFANLRTLYAYMYAHPGKKLLFMGCEFGQFREWNFAQSLDWNLLDYPLHAGLQRLVRDLNHMYESEPAFYQVEFDWRGFAWIDFHDADNSVISFLRFAADPSDYMVVVANFTPVPRYNYRVGVPELAYYSEVLNTDAEIYGGGNVGNGGGVQAEEIQHHGRPASISLTIPPLGVLYFKPSHKQSDQPIPPVSRQRRLQAERERRQQG